MMAAVEEIHQELELAWNALTKDVEYAARYHFNQAYTYGIDFPGFIEHTPDAKDDIPAEGRWDFYRSMSIRDYDKRIC